MKRNRNGIKNIDKNGNKNKNDEKPEEKYKKICFFFEIMIVGASTEEPSRKYELWQMRKTKKK